MAKHNLVKLSLFIVVLGLSSMTLSAEHFQDWQASAVVESHGNQKYKSFFLDEQVYRYCMPDLRDLRLVDTKGQLVPYFIERGFRVSEKSETNYKTLLIKSFQKKRDSFFDFQVVRHENLVDTPGNRLVVTLPDDNFYKEIEFYGSFDGDSWEYMGRAPFYRVDGLKQDSYMMTQTEKFSFYRLKVLNNAENIMLSGLTLIDSKLSEDWRQFRRKAELTYKNRVKGQWSIVAIESPNRLPVCRIHLDVAGNFKRDYQLFESERDTLLQSGILYRMDFKNNPVTSTDIVFSDGPIVTSRFELKIDNQDNRPVKISRLEAVYAVDKLIFEANGSKEYRLFFGNPKAKQPRYDMEYYQEQLRREKQDILDISHLAVQNKPLPVTNKNLKKYFNLVVIITALVLMVLLWVKLRGNAGETGPK